MKSISVKIKKEDKEVMIRQINSYRYANAYQAEDYECLVKVEVLQHFIAKLQGEGALRLNVLEVLYFTSILKLYAGIGVYEEINANLLLGEITKKVKDKFS